MKRVLIALMFVSATLNAFSAGHDLDKDHTYVVFSIMHFGVAPNYGKFTDITGDFDLEKGSFNFTIKTDSISTAHEKRDQHLKSPDFFNAKQFPVIKFNAKKVEPLGGDRWRVTGTMLLRGVKKDMTVEIKKTGEGKDPWGNFRTGITSNFSFKRSDFGMNYMLDGLGDEVNIIFSAEGIRK